eukprot:7903984-Karenia_brevis.AAC.1
MDYSVYSKDGGETIHPVTVDEFKAQLKQMGKGKSADTKGLVVEMLQMAGDKSLESVAGLFNKILEQDGLHPQSWNKSVVTVLFKKGDAQMPCNYRPLTLLPT